MAYRDSHVSAVLHCCWICHCHTVQRHCCTASRAACHWRLHTFISSSFTLKIQSDQRGSGKMMTAGGPFVASDKNKNKKFAVCGFTRLPNLYAAHHSASGANKARALRPPCWHTYLAGCGVGNLRHARRSGRLNSGRYLEEKRQNGWCARQVCYELCVSWYHRTVTSAAALLIYGRLLQTNWYFCYPYVILEFRICPEINTRIRIMKENLKV